MIEEHKSSLRVRPDGLTGPLKLLTLYTHDFTDIRPDIESTFGLSFVGPEKLEDTSRVKMEIYLDIQEFIRYNIYHATIDNGNSDIAVRIIEIPSTDQAEIGDSKNETFSSFHIHQCSKSNVLNFQFKLENQNDEMDFFRKVLGWQDNTFLTSGNGNEGISEMSHPPTDGGIIDHPISDFSFQTLTRKDLVEKVNQKYVFTRLSFITKDIGEILARCHAQQIQVIKSPRKISDPTLGDAIAMRIQSPNGLLIDAYNLL